MSLSPHDCLSRAPLGGPRGLSRTSKLPRCLQRGPKKTRPRAQSERARERILCRWNSVHDGPHARLRRCWASATNSAAPSEPTAASGEPTWKPTCTKCGVGGELDAIIDTPVDDESGEDEWSEAGEAGGSASFGGITMGEEGRQRGAGGGWRAGRRQRVGSEREQPGAARCADSCAADSTAPMGCCEACRVSERALALT